VSSALDILNGGLDAGKATIGYLDGPGGFHLATSEGDAEFFAARRGAGTVLRVDISDDAGNALRSAGASMRSIPRGPKSPFFEGQEMHIPESAFDLFNQLRTGGGISVSPG
jgi:hypothetical protein